MQDMHRLLHKNRQRNRAAWYVDQHNLKQEILKIYIFVLEKKWTRAWKNSKKEYYAYAPLEVKLKEKSNKDLKENISK